MSEPKSFRNIVGEAIGEASMCWLETPTGVFDSDRASRIVDKIFDAFHLEAGMGVTRWSEVVKENRKLKEALESLRLCHPKTHKNKTYLPCAVCTALAVLESK